MTRNFDPNLWRDRWVEELPYDHKNVFIYLSMCPFGSQCGAFEITPKMIANDLEIPGGRARIEEILPDLCKADRWGVTHITWWPELGFVFVHAFYRRQCSSATFAIAAARNAGKLPVPIMERVFQQYPELESTLAQHPPKEKGAKSHEGQESIAYPQKPDSLSQKTDSPPIKTPPSHARVARADLQSSVLSPQDSGSYTVDHRLTERELPHAYPPPREADGLDLRPPFKPPTVAEAEAYFEQWRQERELGEFPPPNQGYRSQAEMFVDQYSLKNWVMRNGQKADDWRGLARGWIGKIPQFLPATNPSSPRKAAKPDLRDRATETFERVLAQEKARQNRGNQA